MKIRNLSEVARQMLNVKKASNRITGAAMTLLLGFLLPGLSFADVGERGSFYRVEISENSASEIVLKKTFETYDGCNYFGTSGGFYKLLLPEGNWNLYERYIADLSIISTAKACPPLEEPREVSVEARQIFEANFKGKLYLDLIIPNGFSVEVFPL